MGDKGNSLQLELSGIHDVDVRDDINDRGAQDVLSQVFGESQLEDARNDVRRQDDQDVGPR